LYRQGEKKDIEGGREVKASDLRGQCREGWPVVIALSPDEVAVIRKILD
jgi:hypothetical protein